MTLQLNAAYVALAMLERAIPEEHETARDAVMAVERELRPCICTRLGEGDDYGLDGFVQHVLRGRPTRRTSLIFGLQVKGTSGPFGIDFGLRLKVSNLCDWEASNLPVLVAAHSLESSATRWRLSADIIAELDVDPDWRNQGTVTVPFNGLTELSGDGLHSTLLANLLRSTDLLGGRTRFHKSIRSVLLTELYHGYAYCGQRASFSESQGGPAAGHFITGMQWTKGEVDERAVVAPRVLSAAMLLFDEAYFPAHLSYAAVGALGPELFQTLLRERRLIPLLLPRRELAFVSGTANDVGDLYFLDADMTRVLERELNAIEVRHGLNGDFSRAVFDATRQIELPEKVGAELFEVSKSPYVRDLLHLGHARPQAQEPVWSAERLLRLGEVVKHYAIAELLGVDVVEFEPGLATLALARWGSKVRFHRVYQALDELEKTLVAAALPDLGIIASRIGTKRCINISSSTGCGSFATTSSA